MTCIQVTEEHLVVAVSVEIYKVRATTLDLALEHVYRGATLKVWAQEPEVHVAGRLKEDHRAVRQPSQMKGLRAWLSHDNGFSEAEFSWNSTVGTTFDTLASCTRQTIGACGYQVACFADGARVSAVSVSVSVSRAFRRTSHGNHTQDDRCGASHPDDCTPRAATIMTRLWLVLRFVAGVLVSLGVAACRDGETDEVGEGGSTTLDVATGIGAVSVSGGWGPGGAAESTGIPEDDPCTEVLEGPLVLSSQADVEAAQLVREVDGDVIIEGSVTSLAPLGCLRRVGGDLSVTETELVDLSGLSGLADLGSRLIVRRNANLESLAGLDALRFASEIRLESNRLQTLGLTELQALDRLQIGDCYAGMGDVGLGEPELEALDTLDGLLALGTVTVWSSPSLKSLEALEAYADRGGRGVYLSFWWNASLDPAEVDAVASALESPEVTTCALEGEDPDGCLCPMGPPP